MLKRRTRITASHRPSTVSSMRFRVDWLSTSWHSHLFSSVADRSRSRQSRTITGLDTCLGCALHCRLTCAVQARPASPQSSSRVLPCPRRPAVVQNRHALIRRSWVGGFAWKGSGRLGAQKNRWGTRLAGDDSHVLALLPLSSRSLSHPPP